MLNKTLTFITKRFGEVSPRLVVNAGIALFLVIIFSCALAIYILRLGALRDAKKESVHLSSLLAEHALLAFESADHVLTHLADDLGSSQASVQIKKTPELHKYLKSHLDGLRHIRSFILNDDKGQLIASTLAYPSPEQYSGDLDFFRVHQDLPHEGVFIDHAIKGRTSNLWLIRESKRIADPTGNFLGVVTAGIDIDYFQSFYESLNFGQGTTLTLLHGDGKVLATYPKNESQLGKPTEFNLVIQNIDTLTTNSEWGIATVKRLEKYPLAILVSMDESRIYGAWWNQSQLMLIGAFIAGSTAALLMYWFASHLRREKLLIQSLNVIEGNYHALINQPLAGVAKVNADTGQYLAVNERLCAMTGYSKQEMLAMTLYDITYPDDRSNTEAYLNSLEDGSAEFPPTFQNRYIHKNGQTIYTVISSRTVKNTQTGITERIGLIQDVTASIKIQAALKEQENRLSIIIHNSMDAIITIDTEEHILIFNAAAEVMFGYPSRDALKMSLSELLPPSLRIGHHAHVRAFALSGGTARKMGAKLILRGMRSNGEEFPLDASISRATSAGKVYMTVILRDLTKQVEAETELALTRAELRKLSIASQTAREEEKSRISRELHDELGQNLTALKMDLSWLQSHSSNELAARNERIVAMQKVLDSTVVATRRIAADLRPLMLDDLGLKAALEWLTQDFTRRLSIPCTLHVDEDVIDFDTGIQSALYRAVQESLTNISRHAQATHVDIALRTSETAVNLQILDNGVGMNDEDLSKRGSFGLIGMRERIYVLGGKVAITSQLGDGTKISIELPRMPSAP